MPSDRSIRVGRIAAEGAVIMVSVFLALAADAWFEQRRDLRLEEAELNGLQQQLIETRDDLIETIERDEGILEATQRLLRSVENEGTGPVAVLDSLLTLQGRTTLFEPPMSRFEGIAASGRLVLIQDDDLRAAIAGWPVHAQEPTAISTRRRDFFEEDFLPQLWADQNLDHWFFTAVPSGQLVSILVDNTLKNMLRHRRFLDTVVLISQRSTLERLDDLLRLIEAALPESV